MKIYQVDTNFALFIRANSETEALDKARKCMDSVDEIGWCISSSTIELETITNKSCKRQGKTVNICDKCDEVWCNVCDGEGELRGKDVICPGCIEEVKKLSECEEVSQ